MTANSPDFLVVPFTGSIGRTSGDGSPIGRRGAWDRFWGRRDCVVLAICVSLAAAVWAVFGQTLHHEFVNYDDVAYVYENPVVQKGLTWEGVRWALTFGEIGHWHPLTWLSHMLDCQLYGLNAGGHHLTSVVIHAATAILLFLVLRQMTGYLWRSAFVAAVFAIHPLRVESVAWISERKDVLAAFFFVVTLGAYVRYVRRPSLGRYAGVMLTFGLGLLCKNMLVTLPFVLLLLDYWPLRRATKRWLPLVAEKIPLLILTAVSCAATALVPEKVTAVQRLSVGLRLDNAIVSYVTYLRQMVWPSGLACVYPNPTGHSALGSLAGALGLLLALSGIAFLARARRPYLIVGWCWCVGMMVPVIGIVQISHYAHADRYTYLPHIGVGLAATWLLTEWTAGWRYRGWFLGSVAALVLPALAIDARIQTSYWRDSESLWAHAIACTSRNVVAHFDLANTLVQKGRVDEAIGQFQRALEIDPNDAEIHHNLGNALVRNGKSGEAIAEFEQAVKLQPEFAEARYELANVLVEQGRWDEAQAHLRKAVESKPAFTEARHNLGAVLLQQGKVDDAIAEFERVLASKPDDLLTQNSLGNVLLQRGRIDEAIGHFQSALQRKPDDALTHNSLGNAFLQRGRIGEAIAHLRRALEIDPNHPDTQNNLAWILATSPDAGLRDGVQAVALAERANRLAEAKDPNLLDTLAAAYAETGRFDDALSCVRKAIELAQAAGQSALVQQLEAKRQLYAAGRPFREERK